MNDRQRTGDSRSTSPHSAMTGAASPSPGVGAGGAPSGLDTSHSGACEPLRVGLVQLGDRRGGIYRYGRIIASELGRARAVSVIEHEAVLSARGLAGLRQATKAVRALKGADVTIVPYGRHRLWAPGVSRVLQLLIVHLGLRRRTVTVLHDVYSPGSIRQSEWWGLAMSTALPQALILHGERERALLSGLPGARRAFVIPHFVESRSVPTREAARKKLGIDSSSGVLGMIGWIHPRKNCELALRALSLLGPGVHLWLVGAAPGDDDTYLRRLTSLACELGVQDRVLVTGYVSELELDVRLAAIDVGLCPYLDVSASASLSTLLAARRPVVASDLPVTRELQRLAPGAVVVAASMEPESLAEAIRAVLAQSPDPGAFTAVLADRSPAVTAQRYLRQLSSVAASRER